jgi:hypothetical protein
MYFFPEDFLLDFRKNMDGCDFPTPIPSCQCSYTWTYIIGIVAVLALILTIVIWIIYFVERGSFLSSPNVRWSIVPVTGSVNIPGDNYVLYTINNNLDTVTIEPPASGGVPGAWFAITNLSTQSVQVNAGSNTQFEISTFPRTSPSTAGTAPPLPPQPSRLEVGQTWFLAWIDANNLLANLVPGGIVTSNSSPSS